MADGSWVEELNTLRENDHLYIFWKRRIILHKYGQGKSCSWKLWLKNCTKKYLTLKCTSSQHPYVHLNLEIYSYINSIIYKGMHTVLYQESYKEIFNTDIFIIQHPNLHLNLEICSDISIILCKCKDTHV